jgi:hypothetical protein
MVALNSYKKMLFNINSMILLYLIRLFLKSVVLNQIPPISSVAIHISPRWG